MTAPIIFTRRELYDLVWSKPMRDLAVELGISDVGLAKVCDRHRIVAPRFIRTNYVPSGGFYINAIYAFG
jgi:hypothetical protein